jgi:four helix bundle protein
MNAQELRDRTKNFALRIIRLFKALPKNVESQVIGKQLLRSALSVAANYRAACRARSRQEFISKISIVVEEADEVLFWLEILSDAGILSEKRLQSITSEALEILKIMASSRKTTKSPNH